MENNEISMFMDVKLDINDRKKETAPFKSWIKCLVKIEAIKCFPCYLRITFSRDVENLSQSLCVRINIPGITVRQATSRTKAFSYGVFWKQNRKRCCIFFALETQVSCELHMKWMKQSMKNLELHRQDILETRRASRCKTDGVEESCKSGKKLQDILGPLPKIPDLGEGNWSRRVSGVSGIYEEIQDNDPGKKLSRVSVASGIYEEMKPPSKNDSTKEESIPTPPPLPPRKRVNTYHSDSGIVHRSYTSPEVDLAKKKKYLTVLENVFGRSKRSESLSEGKVSTAEELYSPIKPTYVNVIPRHKNREQPIDIDKRNSFSSPDLSKIVKLDGLGDLDDLYSISSDLQVVDLSDSASVENFSFTFEDSLKDTESNGLNVSENIQPNFNFSINSSSVNLVGANLNSGDGPARIVYDDLSGYCVMAPIRKNRAKSPNDSDKENEDTPAKTKSPDNVVYECMSRIVKRLEDSQTPEKTYQHISRDHPESNKTEDGDPPPVSAQTPRKSINFDDKVPSYYPNSCDTLKVRRRISCGSGDNKSGVRHLASIKVNHTENFYITSPQKVIGHKQTDNKGRCDSKIQSPKLTPLRACKVGENMYTVTRNGDNLKNHTQINKVSISIESNECTKGEEATPRIYQKYATLARISPNKYLEKCAKKSTEISSVKKFASLPRFKKIDFSPLKIKITNVLQRHHSDGL